MVSKTQDFVDRMEELRAENRCLRLENGCLRAKLEDWELGVAAVMGERCDDERHCTCVPVLRREIKRLRKRFEAAEEALRTMGRRLGGKVLYEYHEDEDDNPRDGS